MRLSLQPIEVDVGRGAEGRLVLVDGRLVAVLVRLYEDEDAAGSWFLEVGFGRLDGPTHPIFPDLEAAQQWCADRIGGRADQLRPGRSVAG